MDDGTRDGEPDNDGRTRGEEDRDYLVNSARERRLLREIIAEHVDCSPDDVTAPDCAWGGECGDANSVDAILVNGRIVATFDKAISAADVDAIYATEPNEHYKDGVNSHAGLKAPINA